MPLPAGIKSVEQLAVEGKRVFVRVDYNVPLDKATKSVTDDARIRATLPTLKHLTERGARIVVVDEEGHWARRLGDDGLASDWLGGAGTGGGDGDSGAAVGGRSAAGTDRSPGRRSGNS